MGFPRQEYWSGLPFPSPGNLPDPGIKHMSSVSQAGSLPSEPVGSPCVCVYIYMDGYIHIQSIGREELDMMGVTEHNTALHLFNTIPGREWALIKCFWNARMNK